MNNVGARGETLAARYLRKSGYTLLDHGFRTRMGEIDLIAKKDGFLAFVEVKTRKEDALVAGEWAVDVKKQRRIIAAARAYLARSREELQPRFDVIAITLTGTGTVKDLKHYENAFTVEGY